MPPIPLTVTSVTPVTSSGVGPGSKFGYTEFTVTFNPASPAAPSGITNYTGTYSYLITPDDGNGNPIESPIRSMRHRPGPPAGHRPGRVDATCPSASRSSGTGGSGTADDLTTSTITIAGHPNQLITGITVRLSLTHQRAGDLTITLTAPDGRSTVIFQGTGNGPLNFVNRAFTVTVLNGGPVNGTYTLTIDDSATNNTGTLTAWSVTVDSAELPTFGLQAGAPMDQNADGTSDQNALTTPFTGLTPGDVYAVPTPQPTAPVTFFGAASHPQSPVQSEHPAADRARARRSLSTSVPGGTGTDNLITDGTTSTLNVTFDRPMQVSTFTPGQVLQIMGPTGSITGPQFFPSDSIGQTIPAATSATGPGVAQLDA